MLTSLATVVSLPSIGDASVDNDTYTPFRRVKAREILTVLLRFVRTCEAVVNVLK